MKGHCTEGVTCTLVGRDRYIQGETFNWNPPQKNLVQDQTAPEFINCKSLLRDLCIENLGGFKSNVSPCMVIL